jgi:hypothetical protein
MNNPKNLAELLLFSRLDILNMQRKNMIYFSLNRKGKDFLNFKSKQNPSI